MVKFLKHIKKLIKNNNASILPITVIAMFIVMIIAYACIKMIMAQNIIETQDQMKLRAIYAAESIAQKQVWRLFHAIDEKINNNPDAYITENAEINTTGITGISGLPNNTFLFSDYLSPSGDTDVALNGTFFIYMVSNSQEDTINPNIQKQEGNSVVSGDLPKKYYADGGVYFYKKRAPGINVSTATLYTKSMDINEDVYPYDEDDNDDPRTMERARFVAEGIGNLYPECVGFYDTTEIFPGLPNNNGGKPIGDIENLVLDRIANTSIVHLNTAEFIGARDTCLNNHLSIQDGEKARISIFKIKDIVYNKVASFYIDIKTRIPSIGKIPNVDTVVRVYFDLFMVRCCLGYFHSSSSNSHFFTYEYIRDRSAVQVRDAKVGDFIDGWTPGNRRFNNIVFYGKTIRELNKKISHIHCHIQKIEVVS